MIPVTPEMIRAGDIDEEYDDLKPRIAFLLSLWRAHTPRNDDPYGRMVYFLLWLRQEVEARRIPIPLNRSYLGTIKYLTGSGEVRDSDDVSRAMGEIIDILEGRGLIKQRHYPLLVSLMDDFITRVRENHPDLEKSDDFFRRYCEIRDQIAAGTLKPPLEPTSRLYRFDLASGKSLASFLPGASEPDYHLGIELIRTVRPIVGKRPYYARKPPMPAPSPGLATRAPDTTVLRDWERQRTEP